MNDPKRARPEIFVELRAVLREIIEINSEYCILSVRDVHGLWEVSVDTLDTLPPHLRQKIFAQAGTYPVIPRFSTNLGNILDDVVSTQRGLGVKIIGIEGVSSGFRGSRDTGLCHTNAPTLEKSLSVLLRGTKVVVEAFGAESPTIKSLGGHPTTHILGETVYTMVPLLFGAYFGKISVGPISPGLTALTGAEVDLSTRRAA